MAPDQITHLHKSHTNNAILSCPEREPIPKLPADSVLINRLTCSDPLVNHLYNRLDNIINCRTKDREIN